MGTILCFTLVYLPQSNGAAESASGIIFTSIKQNIIGLARGKWPEELPRVIWSHNMTESRTTKFTPFRLLYDKGAMVPEEIKLSSLRTEEQLESGDMNLAVDVGEELKLQALQNIERYQDVTQRWENKKVAKKSITVGIWF